MFLAKTFCCLALIAGVFGAKSLRCYSCNSIDAPHCLNPFNTSSVKSKNCSDLVYDNTNYKIGVVDDNVNFIRAPQDSEFECYVLEKKYPNNLTEVHRSCRVIDGKDFCRVLSEGANHQYYNVTHCKTCEQDNCNSAGDLKMSAVFSLSVASFVIFSKFLV